MRLLKHRHGEAITLPGPPQAPEQVHCFDQSEIDAVHAALAARRPLLVRGEPGVGKSQLARALALDLKMAYVQHVIDIRTESRDLLWHFDAVGRLADAQLRGALAGQCGERAAVVAASAALQQDLAVEHYLYPGALWWAFDWAGARDRAIARRRPVPEPMGGCDPANGVVVLIDEIDKAESDVPNGLLEALGAGCFTPQGMTEPVVMRGPAPLVIITTNEERALPDAFLRRCLVLVLALPADGSALEDHLVGRGQAHFPAADGAVLRLAAQQLVQDRQAAERAHWRPLPGQAEYLDLVRAVLELGATPAEQEALLKTIGSYVLQKHLGSPG
ncbi:MoxR family ATPase [uncultured Thiodictyon sp.]|uniref:AAA family ATPase n=1 Tax=uncultured Thiodictyon sp. TaxID=1846217 RepID=UPI0025E606E6|nr:MoxR family ATPase [uncultured Thiodictyon sp.]